MLRGLKVLEKHRVPFDLLFFAKHLHHAATLARMFPELPLVLDHLAKPMIKARRLDNWEANFREAASYPNVYCKLSGMVTEADWNAWKASRLEALRRNRPIRLRPRALHVRLGLAGVRAGRHVR